MSCGRPLPPGAPHHLPSFITAPGDTDILMVVVGIVLIGAVLAVGNLYLHLHTLPERMAHKSQKLQFEIVAGLGLLGLFMPHRLCLVMGRVFCRIYRPDTTRFTRTLPIGPEVVGRVAGVHVDISAPVKKGEVIFRLDSAKHEASLQTAKRKIAEVDAAMLAAQADIQKAEGQLEEAKGALKQAQDELDTKSELQKRNPGIVPQRDIEKIAVAVAGRQRS